MIRLYMAFANSAVAGKSWDYIFGVGFIRKLTWKEFLRVVVIYFKHDLNFNSKV